MTAEAMVTTTMMSVAKPMERRNSGVASSDMDRMMAQGRATRVMIKMMSGWLDSLIFFFRPSRKPTPIIKNSVRTCLNTMKICCSITFISPLFVGAAYSAAWAVTPPSSMAEISSRE